MANTKDRLYKDRLHLTTEVSLTIFDRLKILFGRKLEITTVTDTENEIGDNQTRSYVIVENFIERKTVRMQGAAELPNDE